MAVTDQSSETEIGHKVVSRVGQLQAACLTKIKFRNQIIVESGKPMPDSFY